MGGALGIYSKHVPTALRKCGSKKVTTWDTWLLGSQSSVSLRSLLASSAPHMSESEAEMISPLCPCANSSPKRKKKKSQPSSRHNFGLRDVEAGHARRTEPRRHASRNKASSSMLRWEIILLSGLGMRQSLPGCMVLTQPILRKYGDCDAVAWQSSVYPIRSFFRCHSPLIGADRCRFPFFQHFTAYYFGTLRRIRSNNIFRIHTPCQDA